MSGFWSASNKIPVKQTSTAISSVNGLSFSAGQVVHIDIPPSVKFIQPKESWLQFDFKISNPLVNASDGVCRLQLDGQIGGQSLIRDIRIYSSTENGGVLLEEIQAYNTMVAVKYDYDTDDSIKSKRAIGGEGTTTHDPRTRGTLGTPKSMVADVLTNPYFESVANVNQTAPFTNASFTTAKMMLPLHTGIWSSDKVFPNLLTGCRIEIVLESADRCLRLLESAIPTNRAGLNPLFDSVNGSGNVGGNTKTGLGVGDKFTEFYVTKANSQIVPQFSPFVVGECVSFTNVNGCLTTGSTFTATSGNAVPAPRISQINTSGNASGGDGLIQIVLDQEYELTANAINAEDAFVYSASIDDALTTQNPTYEISNVEMVVQELDMGSNYENSMRKAMSEGGTIGYDVLTATNYKYSQLASDIVANIRLPLNESRARSIVCVPTDSTNYNTRQRLLCATTYDIAGANDGYFTSNSTRSGLVGISDFLTNYQFLYDGKLQPSRQVSTAKISNKISIDAQPLIETEKALVQAGIPCRSFENYNNNFIVCRSFGLNNSVYDTRNKDFNLQLNYQGTAPTKNKLWNNFVFALRRINIKGDSISIVA